MSFKKHVLYTTYTELSTFLLFFKDNITSFIYTNQTKIFKMSDRKYRTLTLLRTGKRCIEKLDKDQNRVLLVKRQF